MKAIHLGAAALLACGMLLAGENQESGNWFTRLFRRNSAVKTIENKEEKPIEVVDVEPVEEVLELKWSENFNASLEKSKETGKPLFVLFTGSDWCIWCKRLENEVFAKQEFIEFANKNFVMFKADFPSEAKQLDFVRKQNEKLAAKYNCEGYPTVMIMDQDGKVLAETGYQNGGPVNYVKHLKKLMKDAGISEK